MSAAPELEPILESVRAEASTRRTRERPQPIPLDEQERRAVVQRVIQFYEDDESGRSEEKSLRVQRYAKLMQYATQVREPFEGASNVQLSDIMSAVLRTEDTLQNSAMATRPMVNAKAIRKQHAARERTVDQLLDFQFFVEQEGEDLLEQISMNFVRDGDFVVLSQWVRELRKNLYVRHFGPIPPSAAPTSYFRALLERSFSPGSWREVEDSEGWDWVVTQESRKQEYYVRFYTEPDLDVTMQVEGLEERYCGPKNLSYDYEDVLAPAWSLNLQPPGPSNPGGAPHVIFVDYPTKDEILRGIEDGFYDLAAPEDLVGIEGWKDWETGDREMDRQRRLIRGQDGDGRTEDTPEEHQQLKRLICFDLWGGLDVVWWVLQGGSDVLLRARPLTEVSPGAQIRRPVAHARMIPVQGTWRGMGLPELMESMHDFMKTSFDMMTDASVFEMFPFFVYRQASNLKPEQIHLMPGGGIPVNNIAQDIKFERANPQATQIGVNLIALAEDMQEKLTSIGDIQLGRIPAGKSSALRTSGGIQQVLAQGEARPERILRRFFSGILDIHRHMYALDRHFLPDQKEFRVLGVSRPEESPFIEVRKQDDLVDYHFDFHANVLNSSKVALQQGLNEAIALLGNPLMIQLGISTPDTLFRVTSDLIRAFGLPSESYVNPPTPGAQNPPITAAEALSAILSGQMPRGLPAEGDFQAHIAALQELLAAPDEMGRGKLALLTAEEQQRVGLYLQLMQQQAMEAQQQAQLLAAAQEFQADRQQRSPAGGGGQTSKPAGPTMVERNDTVNESLPSSGTPQ